jgi:hypothetical protein
MSEGFDEDYFEDDDEICDDDWDDEDWSDEGPGTDTHAKLVKQIIDVSENCTEEVKERLLKIMKAEYPEEFV